MYGYVDKFQDDQEQIIYDSSYIVWVPFLQRRLRPWLERFRARRALRLEQER